MNYNKVIEMVMTGRIYQATEYRSPTSIIRATRKRYGGKFSRGNIDIVLTIGKPNYAERYFIKLCQKANEPFPIKKIQFKELKSNK